MITAISNALTSNTMVNIAQSTKTAMTIETGLKATGRPAFILMDNNISPETKKYAAVKELLYQVTCLFVYLGLVLPVIRKGGFKFFQKHVFKDNARFQKFKGLDEFSQYYKLSQLKKRERLEALKDSKLTKDLSDDIKNELRELSEHKKPEKKLIEESDHIIKGADEVSSIFGSVLGLAILAPQVSHLTIHPIMKWLGLDDGNKKPEEQKTELKLK